MSITLNNSDFQCLQDQLVDLKTKNYELAEKNRRGQADFEAAKAKICSLQLKLEEQERDFQLTSTTLRREIESAYATGGGPGSTSSSSAINGDEGDGQGKVEDYKTKYKKLLHKAKELQQRYEKSVEVVQNMDAQIQALTGKTNKLEEENLRLREESEARQQKIVSIEQEHSNNLNSAMKESQNDEEVEHQEQIERLTAVEEERDGLLAEVERLRGEVKSYSTKIETLAEERRIQDKKGAQMLKELKRQLTIEKSRNETLQKRLESILSEAEPATNLSAPDSGSKTQLSTSSNGNSHGSRGGNTSNNNNQCDDHSNGSWSLVAKGRTSTPSLCSIESEDRETVQQQLYNNCDTISEQSLPQSPSSKGTSRFELSSSLQANPGANSPSKQRQSSATSLSQLSMNDSSARPSEGSYNSGLKFEDQAALMERVTRLQHDKWTLEEKLSYLEQANAALAQDLADKSQVVRQFFMDQAMKSLNNNQHGHTSSNFNQKQQQYHQQHTQETSAYGGGSSSRRVSFPNNINQLMSDKPSLKKMVDFLKKERGQVASLVGAGGGESEAIAREATKKMQVMLEETLIKCLKLQDNLDFVTSELNKLKC